MIAFTEKRGFKPYWALFEDDRFIGFLQKERCPHPEDIQGQEESILAFVPQDTDRACTEKALYFLSKRSLSQKALEQKLRERDFSSKSIEGAVAKMIEYGYIDDEKLMRSFLQQEKIKTMGQFKIRQMLYQRGFPKDLIEKVPAVLAEEEVDLLKNAILLLKKKNKIPKDLPSKEKAFRYLMSRGFCLEIAKKATERERFQEEIEK